ncbi:MAG: 2,4-dienoyl-CoA reductase-like NADH-dependent reductase (Old Yellow Enzyme family) [Glaciecola sp.]|jgi:2,4-dienoyl-CoA reductase-like NADH-dependent reductase (Old Yellow Enzyme family)
MNNTTSFASLFRKGDIADLSLSNRAVVAPMTRTSATEAGLATPQMKKYYQDFADGGFGAVISEGIYTDKMFSQGYLNQPGLADDDQMNAWKPVVNAVKQNGTRFIAQLMHAGGQMQGNRFVSHSIAPSPIAPPGEMLGFYGGEGEFPTPTTMSQDDINNAIEGFVQSARRAQQAGFDGVEIHGANGYLLDQFLSTDFNHRDDQYGGSLSNRLKLILDVITAVRSAVGENFVVGIRLSQMKVTNPKYQWASLQEAHSIIKEIGNAAVDYLHFSEEDALAPAQSTTERSLSGIAKELLQKPIIANGSLGDPSAATQALEQEWADFVAIGKTALANRDWVNAIKGGRSLRTIDFSMLMPFANLTNEQQWRASNGIPATTQSD